MATRIRNSAGSDFEVRDASDGDVAIEYLAASTKVFPPGAALIDAIRAELGLPPEAPEIFRDLPDVEPDYDGEYPVAWSYIATAEQALHTARFAYAVYLRLSAVDPAKVAALAEVLRTLDGETPEVMARNLLLNETVKVDIPL